MIERRPKRVHGASRLMDLPVWVVGLQNGTSMKLVVSNYGTFAVSFPS